MHKKMNIRFVFWSYSKSVFAFDKTKKHEPDKPINSPINLSNLNAIWIEFTFGMNTEILNNLFLGFELQLKNVIKQKNIQNVTNFYIPGFNRTYDSSGLGAGFSYTVSYLIPVVKK